MAAKSKFEQDSMNDFEQDSMVVAMLEAMVAWEQSKSPEERAEWSQAGGGRRLTKQAFNWWLEHSGEEADNFCEIFFKMGLLSYGRLENDGFNA